MGWTLLLRSYSTGAGRTAFNGAAKEWVQCEYRMWHERQARPKKDPFCHPERSEGSPCSCVCEESFSLRSELQKHGAGRLSTSQRPQRLRAFCANPTGCKPVLLDPCYCA